eukprot:1219126-Amphidinium_carterae.1
MLVLELELIETSGFHPLLPEIPDQEPGEQLVLGVPFFRAVDIVFDTSDHSVWFTRSNGAQLIKDMLL